MLFRLIQGSTLTFQHASLVASNNLDVTSQNVFTTQVLTLAMCMPVELLG